MHVFFSVGEPSGDQHAAHLIEELRRRRPGLRVSGYGGPLMQRAGCDVQYRLTDLAVMGFLRVLPLVWRFLALYRQAGRFFAQEKPDAVVLVDFPGFNWWIARQAKAAGIPVFYYMPPQLWAWAPWRIRRVRKFVDHVLCGLPFEHRWYADRGIRAHLVGHPFFDEVADHPLDRAFCARWSSSDKSFPDSPLPRCGGEGLGVRGPSASKNSGAFAETRYPSDTGFLIGVLPGSRTHEVARNWPLMVEILQRLHAKHPDVRFLVACYREQFEQMCRDHLRAQNVKLPVHFVVGQTPEVIAAADCCLMVSGSVSLEMLARRTPAVVVYRIDRSLDVLRRLFVHVPFITLPNLIAGRPVMPEWVVAWTPRRDRDEITATLDGWLSDPARLKRAADDLSALHREVVRTAATARAADVILNHTQPAARAAA